MSVYSCLRLLYIKRHLGNYFGIPPFIQYIACGPNSLHLIMSHCSYHLPTEGAGGLSYQSQQDMLLQLIFLVNRIQDTPFYMSLLVHTQLCCTANATSFYCTCWNCTPKTFKEDCRLICTIGSTLRLHDIRGNVVCQCWSK